MRRVLLVLGQLPENVPDWVEPVDVLTEVGWSKRIIYDGPLYCTRPAYLYALKFIDSSRVMVIGDSFPDITEEPIEQEPSETGVSAIKAGEVTISGRYNPAIKDSSVWLSPFHVEIAKELLSKGCKIELLDDRGNTIEILGGEDE